MDKETVTSLDGDGPCDDCGTTDNIIWFTDNVLWNTIVRADGDDAILCIRCFVKRVEAKGYDPLSWRLLPEWARTSRITP